LAHPEQGHQKRLLFSAVADELFLSDPRQIQFLVDAAVVENDLFTFAV
jgi:hypothetical protein